MLIEGFRHIPLGRRAGISDRVVSQRQLIEYLSDFFNRESSKPPARATRELSQSRRGLRPGRIPRTVRIEPASQQGVAHIGEHRAQVGDEARGEAPSITR